MDATLGPDVVPAADGGKAWKAATKRKGLGPVAAANHAGKECVRVQKVPAPPGSGARKLLAELGHPNKRSLRLKGGDQRAEAARGAVQKQVRRRNALNNKRHASSQMLAGAFLRHRPGLKPLAEAVASWLAAKVDKEDPLTCWTPGVPHEVDEPAA